MSRIAALVVVALAAQVPSAISRQPAPHCLTPEQAAILSYMSLTHEDNGEGVLVPTIRFTGVNVQIVNGTGLTIDATNSRGNLILGYNENTVGATRWGSHSLIIGPNHSWQGSACVISGSGHTAGSWLNPANYAALVGGSQNEVTAADTAVFGGSNNRANEWGATVVGGSGNRAFGIRSLVAGGAGNQTSGNNSAILGGWSNNCAGWYGTITGGSGTSLNWQAEYATIGGGNGTFLGQPYVWQANSLTAP